MPSSDFGPCATDQEEPGVGDLRAPFLPTEIMLTKLGDSDLLNNMDDAVGACGRFFSAKPESPVPMSVTYNLC